MIATELLLERYLSDHLTLNASTHPGFQSWFIWISKVRRKPVNIFAGFIQSRDNIVVDANTVMNVGSTDQFFLPKEPVIYFNPDIGATGKFTGNTLGFSKKELVFPVIPVKTDNA